MSSNARFTSSDLFRIEDICDRFETDCRAGQTNTIGQYLSESSPSVKSHLARQLLRIAWDYQLEQGEVPDVENYLGLLPEKETRNLFQTWLARFEGQQLGQFCLIEKLGSGSFGNVWRAYDSKLERYVSLKIAHPAVENPDKFLREAKSAASLSHPNIASIYDAGCWEDQYCIVREFIDGQPLSEIIQHEEIAPIRAAEICLQLADGLSYSHQQGCIHRDLKPQNILIRRNGVPAIIDFGLAKSSSQNTLTQSGTVMGTANYMSPEQARGDSHLADARTDIYSLGAVLFQALTGEPPFRGSFERVLLQILRTEPVDPSKLNPSVPSALANICLKCLEKAPQLRYATADELKHDLQLFLADEPVTAPRRGTMGRIRRLAARNKLVTGLLVTVALLCCSIVVGSLWFARQMQIAYQNERDSKHQAILARHRADEQTRIALDEIEFTSTVNGLLEKLLENSDPIRKHLNGNSNLSLWSTFDEEQIDSAATELNLTYQNRPRLLAKLHDVFGNLFRNCGAVEKAEAFFKKASKIRRDGHLLEQSPGHLHLDLALHNYYRGWLAQSLGEYQQASDYYHSALHEYECLQPRRPLGIAEVYFQLGWMSLEKKDYSGAHVYFRQAMKIRERQLPHSHHLVWISQLAVAFSNAGEDGKILEVASRAADVLKNPEVVELVNLGLLIYFAKQQENFPRAERLYRKFLPQLAKQTGVSNPLYLMAVGDFCGVMLKTGKYSEALSTIKPVLARARLFAPNHPHVIMAFQNLGEEYQLAMRYEDAEQCFRYALNRLDDNAAREQLIQLQLMDCLIQQDKLVEAMAILPPDFSEFESDVFELAFYWSYTRIYQALGDEEERAAYEAKCKRVMSYIYKRESPHWLTLFGSLSELMGNQQDAEKYFRLAVAKEQTVQIAGHPRIAQRQLKLGEFLLQAGKSDDAFSVLREALLIFRESLPSDDLRIQYCESLLAKDDG